jgi:hypothetical protein
MDTEERKLFEALDDPKWDARTIPGLERSTGLSSGRILSIASQHADLIDIYNTKTYGVVLQLRNKTGNNAPFIEKALDYLSLGKRRRVA